MFLTEIHHKHLTILCLLVLISETTPSYNPQITVHSCFPSKIVANVTGAANGGIIYVKGNGASCQQDTYTGSNLHEFQFEACGINELEEFHLIVQRNPLYQTGSDLQQPIQCVFSLSISVGDGPGDINAALGEGINKTVQPTARMRFYKSGADVSSGVVQLGDTVTMAIQLDFPYSFYLDLRAKYCTANTIPLLHDYCPTENELFPPFEVQRQGHITATFLAFRTTELGDRAVNMVFSCTMAICRGPCTTTYCNVTETISRRKRRESPIDGADVDDVNVGTTLRIKTTELSTTGPDVAVNMCLGTVLTIILGSILIFLLSILIILSVILLRENAYLKGVTMAEAIKIWKHRRERNQKREIVHKQVRCDAVTHVSSIT